MYYSKKKPFLFQSSHGFWDCLASRDFSYSSMDLKSSEKLPFPKPPHPPFWYCFPSSSFTMHPILCIISMKMVGLQKQKRFPLWLTKQEIIYI